MSYSLSLHPRQYNISCGDFLLSAVTLSSLPYAFRHWEQASQQPENRTWHRIAAVISAIPVLGALFGIIERIVHFVASILTSPSSLPSQKTSEKVFDPIVQLLGKERFDLLQRVEIPREKNEHFAKAIDRFAHTDAFKNQASIFIGEISDPYLTENQVFICKYTLFLTKEATKVEDFVWHDYFYIAWRTSSPEQEWKIYDTAPPDAVTLSVKDGATPNHSLQVGVMLLNNLPTISSDLPSLIRQQKKNFFSHATLKDRLPAFIQGSVQQKRSEERPSTDVLIFLGHVP